MTKLKYRFTNDALFKLLFVKFPDLLKRLVAELLCIPYESIEDLVVTNSEMQPEMLEGKFCRLDINMKTGGRRIDLEIQVEDEKNYVERSVFYWAKDFSSELPEGGDYRDLLPTIVISIVDFSLFGCEDFHSEFRLFEVKRHELLTDKMCLHYFELPKIPKDVGEKDGLLLWLSLFRSKTEEDISKIQKMGVPIMEQVIDAYHHVSASDELRELERMRDRARNDEAAAMARSRKEGERNGALKIARNLRAKGMGVDEVAEATGLTVDDILRL